MQIVGMEQLHFDGVGIETIDIWFSERRRRWVVERLDASGDQIGASHVCASVDEAEACLEEWLRTHGETRLRSARTATAAEKRLLAQAERRSAA